MEKGYKIIEINQTEDEKYEVKISDKEENVQSILVEKGDMEVEEFKVGDFVYMDEDGDIENVADSED